MHTDASSTGWGATWNEVVPARGFHDKARRDLHINLLELGAVRLGLLSFVNFLKDIETIVRLVTDSRVVMHVVNNGSSRSKAVMRELRRLKAVCASLGVQLRAEYLPSALNLYADKLSRATDNTDWSLRAATFRRLDRLYGPHTIDLCATAENAKCGVMGPHGRWARSWAREGATRGPYATRGPSPPFLYAGPRVRRHPPAVDWAPLGGRGLLD